MNTMGTFARLAGCLATVVLLASCAESDDQSSDGDAAAERAAVEEAERAAEEAAAEAAEAAERQAQQRRYRACANSVEGLSGALDEINSRLAVGLSNDEYGNYVGDAQVEYDAMLDDAESGSISRSCLNRVAIPLENALNDHITVYNDWGDCIQEYSCDFGEGQVNDDAQTAWVEAGDRTDRSATALDDMRP